ncbi:hypothetical protein JXA70_03115 [candidate division KSB1 bacterium]|nr:hypothetical protein [candidate division KSB1 bacterium]
MRLSLCILLLAATLLFAEGRFYRQYWAEFDENISNHKDGRWRVNDPELALHEDFGKRGEALANGLVLLHAPESLFDLEYGELYLEMWGGHPHTVNKRVTVNGKAVYAIQDYGTSVGHCVYAYPTVKIEPSHLVNGLNALQFSCERGHGFWGHFIIDNVALRCIFKQDSLIKRYPEWANFAARLSAPAIIENEQAEISLKVSQAFAAQIESVEFLGHYSGFDENGNGDDSDWHGYTFKRQWTHTIGRATAAPFQVEWNSEKIPDQPKPVQFKAIITFKNGLFFETETTSGSLLERDDESVQLFYCYQAPIPFWSRAENLNIGKMVIPLEPGKIISAQLHIKIWDGGEGDVAEPFKINGHAYPITSQKAIHDVVHTVLDIDPSHLKNGDNEISLLSDTHHHGIEVLRPGPCLILQMENK